MLLHCVIGILDRVDAPEKRVYKMQTYQEAQAAPSFSQTVCSKIARDSDRLERFEFFSSDMKEREA